MHIVEARPLAGHRLFLRFGNGRSGEVDLSSLKFIGVFEPLRDPEFFAQVTVNPAWGTVMWPNGADMDPDVLYADATGTPPIGNRAETLPAPAPHARLRAAPGRPAAPGRRPPKGPGTPALVRKASPRQGAHRHGPARTTSRPR
jgi:hypothetical protein